MPRSPGNQSPAPRKPFRHMRFGIRVRHSMPSSDPHRSSDECASAPRVPFGPARIRTHSYAFARRLRELWHRSFANAVDVRIRNAQAAIAAPP
ncbi:hypothetical protein WT60_14305 [Burkholderia sp. MSMB617WGS]|nr:hypothetical protein WT60_14305 [Burkholderia sp. MSMB617WGS]KWZ40924.1 hypothetical protein WS73_26925 [Burkholderia savannae]